VKLARDDRGDGPPLVLLHPFPLDRRVWPIAELARRHRVIAPDLRGFGQSALEAPYQITDAADDLAQLLDELGLERAAVGGLSMGGYVALAFADRHPDRLSALLLADTKAGPDTPEARRGRDASMELVRTSGVAAFVEGQIPKLISPRAGQAVRARARELGQQSAEAVLAALAALRDRPDRRAELPRITCPTIVLVGEDDVVTPPAEAEAMVAAIPGARLRRLPGLGHLTALEDPAAFVSAVTWS
jgi:3-oxoadipate enol-lactonase